MNLEEASLQEAIDYFKSQHRASTISAKDFATFLVLNTDVEKQILNEYAIQYVKQITPVYIVTIQVNDGDYEIYRSAVFVNHDKAIQFILDEIVKFIHDLADDEDAFEKEMKRFNAKKHKIIRNLKQVYETIYKYLDFDEFICTIKKTNLL